LIAIPTPALLLEYITIWDDRTPDHMPHVLVECRNENNENEGVHQESGVSCRMCGIFERLDDREGGLFFWRGGRGGNWVVKIDGIERKWCVSCQGIKD
jgi:hypothetical protein